MKQNKKQFTMTHDIATAIVPNKVACSVTNESDTAKQSF